MKFSIGMLFALVASNQLVAANGVTSVTADGVVGGDGHRAGLVVRASYVGVLCS